MTREIQKHGDRWGLLEDGVLVGVSRVEKDAEEWATRSFDETVNTICGLLSTIDFTPSTRHPEECLPWAKQVCLILSGRDNDDGDN